MDISPSYTPEARTKRKQRRLYLVPIYVFCFLYLGALFSSWFFLASPLFKIHEIKISGNVTIPEGEIVDLLRTQVPGDSFWRAIVGFRNFLAWPETLTPSDLVFLPAIEELTISKDYGAHVLAVSVKERAPSGIWCIHREQADVLLNADAEGGSSECWWFDERGFVFKRAISSEGSLIDVIHDSSQEKLGLNLTVLPPEFIANALSILKVLKASGLNIQDIVLADISLREIEARAYDGPKMYFSLAFPADTLLQVMSDLQSKPGFQNLQYLDFRVENKVYYK